MAISVVHLRTSNGNYVCAEDGGGGVVDASRNWARAWETFTMSTVDPSVPAFTSGAPVNLRAANGMYVCAENGGGGAVNANRVAAADWETFTLEVLDGSALSSTVRAHFKTSDGTHFLCAENGGGGALNATRTVAAEWETFVIESQPTPAETRLTIDIVNAYCRDTEDLAGPDELYLAGAVTGVDGPPTAILTSPISINDGQTRSFDATQSRIFDGKVRAGESVALLLKAFDEDVQHDWRRRPEWVDTIGKSVATAGGKAIAEALASNPVGWATLGGLVLAGAVAGGFLLAIANDRDDLLGELDQAIPALGPTEEDRDWSFSRGGYYSSWNYRIHYHISRS